MTINQENIYWLFSSSAQAISAFIAFLLTGYAFVHAVMESIQQRDDSLIEIHHELRRRYYRYIKWLSLVTGTAIISSLLMVYLNGTNVVYKEFFVVVVSSFNLVAIIGGILFVLAIIDPDRYKKTATKIVAAEAHAKPSEVPSVRDAAFFDEFIQLELQIKSLLTHRDLLSALERSQRFPSFRQMITALYQSEIINQDTFKELQEISRYRNLVFHGQIQQVDSRMIDRIRTLSKGLIP
jgi:hypothetical protein